MNKFITRFGQGVGRVILPDYVRSLANRSMPPVYREKYAWKGPVLQVCELCAMFSFVDGNEWYDHAELKGAMDLIVTAMMPEVPSHKPFPKVLVTRCPDDIIEPKMVRPMGHFEIVFKDSNQKRLIVTAVRYSMQRIMKPFVVCEHCNRFQIRNYNGESWYIDNMMQIELKTVMRLIGMEIASITPDRMNSLVEMSKCNVCK